MDTNKRSSDLTGSGHQQNIAAALPPRRGIYLGWWMVAVSTLTNMAASGTTAYALGFFLLPMADDLHLSRAVVAGSATIRVLCMVPFAPFIGALADKRHGMRVLLSVGGLLFGGALALMALVHSWWQLYLFSAVWGLGNVLVWEGITATLVSKWFYKKRSLAISIASTGFHLGGIALIPLTQALISGPGWRLAWIVLGGVSIAAIVPLALVVVRRSPEDVGVQIDGDDRVLSENGPASRPNPVEYSWNLHDAIRTPSFWLIIVSTNLLMLAAMGLFYHLPALLKDKNFSDSTVAFAMFLYPLVQAMTLPFWGLAARKFHVRYVIMVSLVASAVAMAILLFVQSLSGVIFFMVFYAVGVGGYNIGNPLIWADYYGPGVLGSIRGISGPFSLAIMAVGPLVVAMLFDKLGSYVVAIVAFAVIRLVAALFIYAAKPPKPTLRTAPVGPAPVQGRTPVE